MHKRFPLRFSHASLAIFCSSCSRVCSQLEQNRIRLRLSLNNLSVESVAEEGDLICLNVMYDFVLRF